MDNSLIKHQAAIDAWRADFKGYVDCLDLPRDDYNGIMEYINEAPSAQTEITLESAIDYLHKIGWMQEHDRILTESAQPEPSTEIQEILNYLDTELHPIVSPDNWNVYAELHDMVSKLPSAQPDIKQAAKLLSDFIESCPSGDSYLITPDGEELITDWGYATEGIQLIHDWAERRTDGNGRD